MVPHGPAFCDLVPLGLVNPLAAHAAASRPPIFATSATGQTPTVLLRHACAHVASTVLLYTTQPSAAAMEAVESSRRGNEKSAHNMMHNFGGVGQNEQVRQSYNTVQYCTVRKGSEDIIPYSTVLFRCIKKLGWRVWDSGS